MFCPDVSCPEHKKYFSESQFPMYLLIFYTQYSFNLFSFEHFVAKKLGSDTFITGPGRYRKVEEKQRANSVKFVGRSFATLKSCDQKAE